MSRQKDSKVETVLSRHRSILEKYSSHRVSLVEIHVIICFIIMYSIMWLYVLHKFSAASYKIII